jgi:hypothetical protein
MPIARLVVAGPRHSTERRRKTQGGQEIFEFALALVWILVPLFIGSFIIGMNLIRSIQANQVCRDLDDMYIHGADFSTYPIQQEAQRLAQGLNLQIGSSFAGNEQANTGTGTTWGSGLVTVTQIMWIGGQTSGSCTSVAPQACTNESSFVYTQQIQFGNSSLANSNTVTVGQCPTAILNTSGVVQSSDTNGVLDNYITDSRAALPATAQSAMQALWQSGPAGTTPLTDQQVVYIVETYFQSPTAISGSVGIPSASNPGYTSTGVYARYFF